MFKFTTHNILTLGSSSIILVLGALLQDSCIPEKKPLKNLPITDEQPHQSYRNYSLTDWMSAVDGNKNISELSIPGTHNSGTKGIWIGAARCQNFDIAQQLKDGIRFLDIRLSDKNKRQLTSDADPLSVTHGIVSCNITFGKVLEWCDSFLKAHGSETIIMSIKAENNNGDISEPFKKYLKKYNTRFFHGNTLPSLKEVRGKIVLFYRFNLNVPANEDEIVPGWKYKETGIDINHFTDNATFSFKNNQGEDFFVEDNYKSYDIHHKIDQVKYSLEQAMNGDKKAFHITFNSIAWKFAHHTPYRYAWGSMGVCPPMNGWLTTFLQNKRNQRLGAVLSDYYNNKGNDTDLTSNIILSNFE